MAGRKKIVRRKKQEIEVETPSVTVTEETKPGFEMKNKKWIIGVVAVLCLTALFWWKTNSWPIVAFVNYWPVTRFEIDQALYKQAGAQALDSIITQRLVDAAIAEKKIMVGDSQVEEKLSEIKKNIGSEENFEQLLQMQGVSLAEVKKQIKLQMALERLVDPSTDSAKLQEDIYKLLQDLRSRAKIWTINEK